MSTTLLTRSRFAAYFWTQFLGAFNDNVFRNALVILVTFGHLSLTGVASATVVALAGGIFILPFFLFSAFAGQLADKFPKHLIIRGAKAAEVAIMALAVAGFAYQSLSFLLLVLFLMGTQSAFFGPAKFSVLPQLVDEDDLVGANALVETGTFIAILGGTIVGGVLVSLGASHVGTAGTLLVAVAALGLIASCFVPRLPAADARLTLDANPVAPLRETWGITRRDRAVFLSVLGIAWFWFFGSALLAVLPTYTTTVLRGNPQVITMILGLFCLGIGVGSMLCERLSEHKLELGLVPFGSIGMTIFAFDLFLIGAPDSTGSPAVRGIRDVLVAPHGLRIVLDLALLATFSGFYIVPLNAVVQQRSDPRQRSQVIAGSNIMAALFMVCSSLLVVALLALQLSVPQILLVLAVLNAAVALYIYTIIPEFLLRFVAWIVASIMYRLRTVGREHIPLDGPALLVANHVSFVDWLVISSGCKRPIRFVMYHGFLKLPLVGFLFRDAKVIPIAPAKEAAETLDAAYDRIAEELEAGNLVCIFPEGKITWDGRLGPFRRGVERIVARTPVPVVPMALKGLWGSFFSRMGGGALRRPFRRFWSRIELVVGRPIEPENATAEVLAAAVAGLGGLDEPEPLGPMPAPAPQP